MKSRRRISALRRVAGEPIAVQVLWERLSHEADGRIRTPTGWCYKAPPSPKEGPGRTSNEAPAARRGFSRLGRLLQAVVARRGSGPLMRFSAREAPVPARAENRFLSRLPRGSPGDDPAGDAGDPGRDLRLRSRVASGDCSARPVRNWPFWTLCRIDL
jgi:hypothetical protein